MTDLTQFDRLSKPWVKWFMILSILYWLWFAVVVGIDDLNIYFYIMITFFFFNSARTRKLLVVFSPFFIYMILYSSLKVLHKFNVFTIHIEDLYELEVKLFGIWYNGKKVPVSEYFVENLNPFLDFYAGASYITWVPFPILFALILFFSNKPKIAFNFWISFLIANLLGFIGYITYPAAPPWYYFEYGSQLIVDLKGNAAGLARFDDIIGMPIYKNMYSEGTNTFGAMPSMHAAFPLLLTYFSLKFGKKWITIVAIISMVGIWFGAVYTAHHYIIDIIFGILCGILAIIITESLINRKFAVRWYESAIDFIRK